MLPTPPSHLSLASLTVLSAWKRSDLVALIFTFLVLTFAIDHYLNKSRYLIHVRGVKRAKDHAAVLDEKAFLHEKEALKVESGQKRSDDEGSDLRPKLEHSSASAYAVLPGRSRILRKAIWIVVVLFLFAVSDCTKKEEFACETGMKTLGKSDTETEAEKEANKSPPNNLWGKFVQHPRTHAVLVSAMLLVGSMVMLVVFTFQVIFWPALLVLLILQQCAFTEHLNPSATVPWQSIALKSTLYLAVWTVIGVTLLLKPNRFQGVPWKCFKWTHAIHWWLFWAVNDSYSVGNFVAKRFDLHYIDITSGVMFVLHPLLVAYLYSGLVCDVVVALRLCKYFWNNDVMKL